MSGEHLEVADCAAGACEALGFLGAAAEDALPALLALSREPREQEEKEEKEVEVVLKDLKELREKACLAIAKIAATAPVQVPKSQKPEWRREALTQPVKAVLEKAIFVIEVQLETSLCMHRLDVDIYIYMYRHMYRHIDIFKDGYICTDVYIHISVHFRT